VLVKIVGRTVSERGRSWLRLYTTRRKVMNSILDGFFGVFHWLIPSGRIMALGSTQPLREISAGNISWGLKRPVPKTDKLTILMCRLSWNLGTSTSWNPQDLSRDVQIFFYFTVHENSNV